MEYLVDIEEKDKLNPAGRLDADSKGLLLLTDDGMLNHRVSHPKWGIEKEYIVKIKEGKLLSDEEMDIIRSGMKLYSGEVIKKVDIERIDDLTYKLILTEGKIHIIKRIFKTFNIWIDSLIRVRIGNIKLGTLKEGRYRFLTEKEIKDLKKLVKLES